MKSVKTKIFVLVLSCIILLSTFIGGAAILHSRAVVSSDSVQIMNLLCDNKTEELNAFFTSIEQSVTTLAVLSSNRLEDLDRFKTDSGYVNEFSDSIMDIAVNSALHTNGALTVYLRFNPEFTDPESGFFFSINQKDRNYRELPPTNLALYEPDDLEHTGWFFQPAKNRKGTWMSPYFNDNINMEIISYVIPMFKSGELVGVVGMDIDFRILQEVIAKTGIYKNGYAFLTDEKANVIYHRELPRNTDMVTYNNGEFAEMAGILSSQKTNGNVLIPYNYQGKHKDMAFRSLINGMRLALVAPVKEIDAQANQLLIQIIAAILVIAVIATILTFLFTKRLVKPLLELTSAAKMIAAGDLSVSITHHSSDELGALAESFRQTVDHLHKYISYINELAYRDSLTGVKNKTAYQEMIRTVNDPARLKKPQYAVVVMDINGLKRANDTMGHNYGDHLIISACSVICKTFKRSPVYRIGGDEFAVLLENHDYDHYEELTDQFQLDMDNFNRDAQNEIKVSIAIGAAFFTPGVDTCYEDVFRRADNIMYQTKSRMKKSPEMDLPH